MTLPRSRAILGVRVDDVTYEETLEFCRRSIRSGKPRQLVTVNTEFVVAAQNDASFKQVINAASLAVPDGGGLLLACRLHGFPLREQVRGTDLADRLAELCAREGHRLFLLGAAEGVAADAGRRLCEKYPGLQLAGTYGGSPDPRRDAEMVARVKQGGRVDVLLVAYGAPAQELWIARNLEQLGTPVAMGVGGVFDYFSGRVPRAPRWLRELGLEWLYRLIRQPWRWRRQLALPRFALTVLWSTLRQSQTIVPLRGDPLASGGDGD